MKVENTKFNTISIVVEKEEEFASIIMFLENKGFMLLEGRKLEEKDLENILLKSKPVYILVELTKFPYCISYESFSVFDDRMCRVKGPCIEGYFKQMKIVIDEQTK